MARTVQELKDAIISSLDIASFYQSYIQGNARLVQETSDGWSNRVLCPIHRDQTTPNLFINLKTGNYKCFACKGGSIFDFYLDIHNQSRDNKQHFSEALLALAKLANFDIEQFQKSGNSNTQLSSRKSSGSNNPPQPSASTIFTPPEDKTAIHDRDKKPIDPTVIEHMHRCLRPDHVTYLNQKRGLTLKTIQERKIGWDENAAVLDAETQQWYKGRYSIPIPDANHDYRNIREYSSRTTPDYKMINYVTDKKKPTEKRYGSPPRLFGIHESKRGGFEHAILCEGEWKKILLSQLLETAGYNTWIAYTGTAGAKSFQPEWITEFFGKHVYICLDCDEPGKLAALEIVNKYFLPAFNAGKFLSIRIVTLPLEGTKESKDINDYFLDAGFSIEDFVRLCLETPEMIVGGVDHDDASLEPIVVEDFVAAIKDRRYIDQRIETKLTISGVSSRTYHAIRSYTISNCEEEECCSANAGERTIPYGHSLFIEACNQPEAKILQSLSCMACIKKSKPSIKVIKKVVMEEYFAHQVVERWRAEENAEGKLQNTQELVQASIYVLQPPERIDIEPQNYKAIGWVRTHPRTCMATFFVESLVPMEEDWKKFSLRSTENRELIGRIKQEFTLRQILDEITHGVTKIYEAEEILYAVLLTYLCPLQFAFNGSALRGWINTAIIGDSGTGKSATYVRFSDWLELGDLFSALSGSRTGLLYSIKQRNGEWQVSIGCYVQANRKIIAVDETQEMESAEIKQMAVAMETGYLKVARVASGGYHTRVRAIFLMNPKNKLGQAATISDFANGCESLRMCFDPMFIRRLDLAVFTTGKSKYEFYNQKAKLSTRNLTGLNISTDKSEMRLTPKMMKALVYWAWTRKMSQVQWSDEATNRCLHLATELAKVFGDADQIPLVNPQDFRENLARISVAYAILDRSFTEDLESVIIEAKHVEAMAELISILYSSPACNLKQQSQQARQKNSLDDFEKIKKSFEEVIEQMKTSVNTYYRTCNPFLQLVLLVHQVGTVRQNDIADQIGVSRSWVQKRLAILQSFNLLEITRYGYKSTRKFNLFMREWRLDEKVERMLTQIQAEIGKYALLQDDTPMDPDATPVEESFGYAEDPFSAYSKKVTKK